MLPNLGFDLKWLLAAASTVPTSTEMIWGLAKPLSVVEEHTLEHVLIILLGLFFSRIKSPASYLSYCWNTSAVVGEIPRRSHQEGAPDRVILQV